MPDVIILYTKDGCVKCKQLKTMLDKNNIKYETNSSVDEMLSLGFTSTPVLSVNGENMYLKEAEKWIVNHKLEKMNEN